MQINYKRVAKLLTLTLSALLIATVSAESYRYMFINGTITISNTGLTWLLGDSASGGSSVAGSTATIALSISNGTILNFTHYLYLKNLDASSHSLTISITDAATSSLYETNGFNITLSNNATSAYIGQLDALSGSSTYSGTVGSSAVWHITFELATKVDATGSDNFALQFTYQ